MQLQSADIALEFKLNVIKNYYNRSINIYNYSMRQQHTYDLPLDVDEQNKDHHSLLEEEENQFVSQGHLDNISRDQEHEFQGKFNRDVYQKKMAYLKSLKINNVSLVSKIKQIDAKLNVEIHHLTKKTINVKPKETAILRFQKLEDEQLQNTFKKYEKLKKQVEMKKIGKNSLEYLMFVNESYRGSIDTITNEIKPLKKHLIKLMKFIEKEQLEESARQRQLDNLGPFNLHEDEIYELKNKIKLNHEKIKAKRQSYFQLKKRNKSNVLLNATELQRHQEISSTKKLIIDHQVKQVQTDPQIKQLKESYEKFAKRVDALKLQKNLLMNKHQNGIVEKQKLLNSLKVKLEAMNKIKDKA